MQDKKQKVEDTKTKPSRSLTEAIRIPELLAFIADFFTAGERAQALNQVSRVLSDLFTKGSKAAMLYKREVDRESIKAYNQSVTDAKDFANNAWIEFMVPLSLQPKNHKQLCQLFHLRFRPDKKFYEDVVARQQQLQQHQPSITNRLNESAVFMMYVSTHYAFLAKCLLHLAEDADKFEPALLCTGHCATHVTKDYLFRLCTTCRTQIEHWQPNVWLSNVGRVISKLQDYLAAKMGRAESWPSASASNVRSMICYFVWNKDHLLVYNK